MKALKNFGLGLVWVFLIPFIAAAVVVVGLFGIINFFVQFVIMVINFFRGKKLFPMFDEDEEAYEILQKAIDRKKGEQSNQPQAPAPQQVFVQQNFYTNAPSPNQGQGLPNATQNPFIQANPQQNPYGNIPGGYQNLPNQPYGQMPNPNPQMISPTIDVKGQEQGMPELAKLPQYNPEEDKK